MLHRNDVCRVVWCYRNFVVISAVEVSVYYGGVYVFNVRFDLYIVYSMVICVDVCGVVCVAECCLFLQSGCCLLCCFVVYGEL